MSIPLFAWIAGGSFAVLLLVVPRRQKPLGIGAFLAVVLVLVVAVVFLWFGWPLLSRVAG